MDFAREVRAGKSYCSRGMPAYAAEPSWYCQLENLADRLALFGLEVVFGSAVGPVSREGDL